MKWHFANLEPDDRGLHDSRGYACEIIAWRFLGSLSERDLLRYLLCELSDPGSETGGQDTRSDQDSEEALLPSNDLDSYANASTPTREARLATSDTDQASSDQNSDITKDFIGRNALEIAAVAEAKKFLSQTTVQNVINAIWYGDIVFWDSIDLDTKKKAQRYSPKYLVDIPVGQLLLTASQKD